MAKKKASQNKKNKKRSSSAGRSGSARRTSASAVKKSSVRVNRGRVENSSRSARDGRTPSGAGREIFGVVLVILGLLLGIFCYFGSTGLLAVAAPVLFGLFGIATYAVPVLLVALGVMLILLPRSDLAPRSLVCIVVLLLSVLGLIHVIACGSELVGAKFGEAMSRAIVLGKAHAGGGFFGGLISFLFVKLAGVTGGIIALVGVALIAALLLTHFSISAHFEKLREMHRSDVERRRTTRQQLYNEELKKPRKPGTEKPGEGDGDEFIKHSGAPLTSGDTDYDYGERRRSGRSSQTEPAETGKSKRSLLGRGQKQNDGPEFFPSSGPLSTTRQTRRHARKQDELKESPNIVGNVGSYGWVAVDEPDPSARRKSASAAATAEEDPELLSDVSITRYDEPPVTKPGEALIGGEKVPITYTSGDELPSEIPEEKHAGSASDKNDKSKEQPSDEGDAAAEVTEQPVPEYQRPPLTLLKLPDPTSSVASESPEEKARILIETLNSFNISARIVNISVGPVITRYELQPAQGVRVNRITNLSNDIALALAAPRVRIEAPIPGKSAIGIEIPNRSTAAVLLRELLETPEFDQAKSPLTFALGKDIAGKPVFADLSKMPHMLVAGQTGSGKSVCINGIILSMVYKSSPKDVRMILVDPKVVELSIFSTLPHLFCPVVTEPKKAAGALRWAVNEMDTRYRKMADFHARDIDRYNAIQTDENERWPRLVIIIDELADLMLVAAKDVEDSICRIAQLGRACGIHLIVATQRPSVDVITGLIKANIPSRIAFAVSNGTDSRVILDAMGAEKLLGRGDMLFHPNGASKPIRAQGAYVDDEEVEAVAEFFTATAAEQPSFKNTDILEEITSSGSTPGQGNGKQEDELLPEAVRLVIESGAASISMIQRRLRVGYARAARLIDIMEQKGYVSRGDGSKPRQVLISAAEYNRVFGDNMPEGGESGGEE